MSFVLLLIFSKRKEIKRFLDEEMSDIKDFNELDKEAKSLIDYYLMFSTEELMNGINSKDLSKKERWAIKRALDKRQSPPPFS